MPQQQQQQEYQQGEDLQISDLGNTSHLFDPIGTICECLFTSRSRPNSRLSRRDQDPLHGRRQPPSCCSRF